MLAYDITDEVSFNSINNTMHNHYKTPKTLRQCWTSLDTKHWLQEIRENNEKAVLVLVGTKCDNEKMRQVDYSRVPHHHHQPSCSRDHISVITTAMPQSTSSPSASSPSIITITITIITTFRISCQRHMVAGQGIGRAVWNAVYRNQCLGQQKCT